MPEVFLPPGVGCAPASRARQGACCPTPGLGLEEGAHALHLAGAWPGQAEEMAFAVPSGWQGSAMPYQQGAVQLGVMSAVKIHSLWCVDLDAHGLSR